MLRLLFIILYILQYIFITNGQNVQTMPPKDSCVPAVVAIDCPNNYVIVVKSASYGIAQTDGSCVYTKGDCIADAMSLLPCTDDNPVCQTYVTKRKLSQCNDQESSYIHIEYDCVPISMGDSAKEYNVCQNGTEITSDHGIIKSPGYPTQFQTTTYECFRAIHVSENQTIRLWLSDLFIGSTSTNCADDHLYVVDSIQTYKYCGLKRYAYPYLCSSTIIIQYLVTTQLLHYRGLRMYFEIVDRPADDNCPNPDGTVTPIPVTTPILTTTDPDMVTVIPIYVTLGIASPVRSFQLCKGESYKIECPNNYVVVVLTNIFGVTEFDQCEPHDAINHCVVTTDPTFMCRQSCTYMYSGHQVIPTCSNKTAAYQYVEYQCIPTNTGLVSPNAPCPTDGSKIPIHIDRVGRFQSYEYPNLKTMNCTYRLQTTFGHIMRIYSLDISLNDFSSDCNLNKLTLIEDGESQGSTFCQQRSYSLIYSTCSHELDLQYIVTDTTQSLSYGAELYIESQTRPLDWSCGTPVTIPTDPTPISSTPFTTPTATPLTNQSFMIAQDEVEHDICFNTSIDYICPSGYTFMILGAFYGVKSQTSNKCGFIQGDCTQEALSTISLCRNDVPNCYLPYPIKRRLAHCSDYYADYLHITSQCVPSKSVGSGQNITTFDICDTNNPISQFNGVIISPGFPDYRETTNECKRTLMAMQDRVLKIWLNELAVSSGGQRHLNEDSNEPDVVIYKDYDIDNLNDLEQMYPSIRDTCIKDYLIINAPHVAYVFCGIRKLAIAPICGTSVIIQYKATSTPISFYKGFKFYFEWVEKPIEISCNIDPLPSTTTPGNEPLPIWAQNLELSPILSEHICFGSAATLRCPRGSDYVLSILASTYGVSGTGLCEIPVSSHCRQEASLGLTCTHSCFVEYNIPKPLVQCGNQNADYLNIDYECIPTRLPNYENPIDICSSPTTDTIAINTGIIVSPKYPSLDAAYTCSKTIETTKDKLWMVFIVDLFLEGENDAGECNEASLTIYDGNDKIISCGLHQPQVVLISCSNLVQFNFVSTLHALGYRGFKVYFKTIDILPGWSCVPSGFTSTSTTPRPPITGTSIPPSSQILAYGGTTNGTRQYCKFPFIYQGNPQANCLRIDPPSLKLAQSIREPWCSLTSNFDADRQWGFCELSIPDSSFYDICRNQSQILQCPPDYVINIINALYAAKPDGSIDIDACSYNQIDCFQRDSAAIQNLCAGKPSCIIYHNIKTLTSCQNRQSAYFHIEYTCIPNDVPEINSYDMCNSGSLLPNDTRRGYIISPNFPNTQNNIDNCTFNLQTLKSHQVIYLYILDMDLNSPNTIGESCTKDRLIINADNNIMEICDRSYTNFLINTCHTSISLQLIRASDAKGRGVKLYFEFREEPEHHICIRLITTTTDSPTSSPEPITNTTTAPPPTYFPEASPRMFKTLCYPDSSSSFGTNNFRCPHDYVIVIHRAYYGKGNRCDYTSGDCTSEADIVYRTCSGKQACSVSFMNVVYLSECDKDIANYLFVEYQCLPTPKIVSHNVDLCTGQIDHFAGVNGILKSSSYPSYTQTQCANVTLSSLNDSNLVIYMYVLDLNIGLPDPAKDECSNDYLLLSYQCNNQLYSERLCGIRSTELLFSTCLPTDKIFASYHLLNSNSQSQRGFALLYHLLPKPEPITTPETPYKTTTPSEHGPISTIPLRITTCVQQPITIRCELPEYVLILHKVQLGVSTTGNCTYSSNDCFEDRTNLYNTCAGKTSCNIVPPLIEMKSCNNSKPNYLSIIYQCIPTRPNFNFDICSATDSAKIVEGGTIISSLNYTSAYKQCNIILRSKLLIPSEIHKGFKIYILTMNLPTRPIGRGQGEQCSKDDPLIEIDDHETGVTRLCGNSHTRFLVETCSNMIEIRYNNVNMGTGTTQYKGFEIYFESIENDQCHPATAPPIPTKPYVINNTVACGLSNGHQRVDFSCESDYGLVFLQSYYFVTKHPDRCDITQYTCHYPNEQPQAQCSGQQTCSYTHVIPHSSQLNPCHDDRADSTQFYYQCLPMKPSSQFSKVTLCRDSVISTDRGFIETPNYPNTYKNGRQQCSLRIPLLNNTDGKKYSIYLYIIELSIRDTSIISPSSAIECFDSLTYTDGDLTYSLCGKIDQPLLEYHTNKKELNLTFRISEIVPSSEVNNWQGARLFFIIGNQSLPLPPTSTSTPQTTGITAMTSTSDIDETSTISNPGSNNGGLIAGIISSILVVLLLAGIGFVVYRRRFGLRSSPVPTVKYDVDMISVDDNTAKGTTEKRSSIPINSLKGPASTTFINPYYENSKNIANQETEHATDA